MRWESQHDVVWLFCSEANGAQRSSELVLRLNGSSEATEGMFEMIFNRSEGMLDSLKQEWV